MLSSVPGHVRFSMVSWRTSFYRVLHPVLAHQARILWLNESRWTLFKGKQCFLTLHWHCCLNFSCCPGRKGSKFTVTVNAYKNVRCTDAGSMWRIKVRTVHQGRYWTVKNDNIFTASRKQHRRFFFFCITCSAEGLIIFVAGIVLADHVIFTFAFKEKKD